jgi:hypothetical protein
MSRFKSKKTLISLAVMLGMFFIGVSAARLWKIERDWAELSRPKTVATPASAPPINIAETAPRASDCDWIKDSKLSKDPAWSSAKTKRSIEGGVLDSKVCHVETNEEGNILKITGVSFSTGVPVEPIVKVTIDINGYVRDVKVVKKYDPIPDEVLVEEAFKIRMSPVRLGGGPTVVTGVLSSRFFDAVVRNKAF